MAMTNEQMILIAIVAGYVLWKLNTPSANVAPAVEGYSGVDQVTAQMAQTKVSSAEKDKPWVPQKQLTKVGAGALKGVGWPQFQVNLPRMDDREF